MSFRDFLKLPRRDITSPKVKEVVQRTVDYLDRITSSGDEVEVRPAMLAQTLHESEIVAVSALYLLEKAGIVNPHVGVYCRASMTPIEADNGDLSTTVQCPACFEEHTFADGSLRKELFFTVDREALRNYRRRAA